MASVTKENEHNQSSRDDDRPDEADIKAKGPDAEDADDSEGSDNVRALESAKRADPAGPGFFTVYKKGQGYWTRMGTLAGVAIIGALLAWTLFRTIPDAFFGSDPALASRVGIGLAGGFLLIYTFLAIRFMNKPSYVDFLIATDSEMRKVNWTSRKELIGSCKVVIVFMFMMTLYLFVNDTVFGYLMYLIGVMKVPPPPFQ